MSSFDYRGYSAWHHNGKRLDLKTSHEGQYQPSSPIQTPNQHGIEDIKALEAVDLDEFYVEKIVNHKQMLTKKDQDVDLDFRT